MARGKLAELFYDLRANTEGLGTDLKGAENQMGKLSAYVLKHPVAAIGALAAAVVGVGIAATKMAEEVEGNLRKIEARVPQTAGRMGELRDMIRDISLAGPHSQAELAGAAAEIARQGVGSLEEIQQRLNAVVKVADATGEDMTGIVAGLDQAMDMFGMSADETEGFLAKLYATAANRMPITDLFAAFQTAAPAVRAFGLDADTTMRALGALLERGLSAKQAGSELKAYAAAGTEGAAAIKQLAGSYTLAGDALDKLNAAQAKMNDSAEASSAKIRNNLNAALIELGDTILPIVEKEMRGLVGILAQLNGAIDKIEGKSFVATMVTGFSTSGKGVGAQDFAKQVFGANTLARKGQLDLGGLSVGELDKMRQNITAVAKETGLAESQFFRLTDAITKARDAAVKLATEPAKAAPVRDGGVRSADEITAGQAAAKKTREEAEKQAAASIKDLQDRWAAYNDAAAASLDFIAQKTIEITGNVVAEIDAMFADAIAHAPTAEAKQRAIDLREKFLAAKLEALALKSGEEAVRVAMAGVKDESIDFGNGITKNTERLIAQARALQQAVDGALQLAQAFGVVDERIGNSLRALNQIVGSIPALADALKNMSAEKAAGGGFGKVIIAGLPIAGAVATVVGGLIASAKAAREHAEALRAARVKLAEGLTDRMKAMGLNDTQRQFADIDKQRKDDIASMLDLLIQQKGVAVGTRSDFLSKDAAGQREVLTSALGTAGSAGVREALRAAIQQFDLLAASAKKAAAQLEEELAAKRKGIDESLAERRLALAGRTEERDALAFARAMEQELADARAGGVYTAEQLIELQSILNDEQTKYLADAKKRREEEDAQKAQAAARRTEDLQTRINAADGETPAERALRVSIEHRRELEDAMAAGADAAELALIALAQAADDAAAAAQAAADAQRAATAAQRELEDFDVELLRLQGKGAEADSQAFENDLKRQFEDAVAAGKSPEHLAKLAEVQAARRATRASNLAGEGAAAAAAGAGRGGGSGVANSAIQNITITQADRLVSLTGTLVAYAHELPLIKDLLASVLVTRAPLLPPALPSSFTVGAGGQVIQIRVTIAQTFNGPIEGGAAGAQNLSAELLRAINAGLGSAVVQGILGRGDASR